MNEDYPTWTNTHADVATYAHGRTISSFITDIVHPSVAKLEDKTEAYRHSEDPVDAFNLSDTEDLISETLKAFCLSLNSIWERQLRAHMSGVARELFDDPKLIKSCQKLPWNELNSLYHKLRGFKLDYFRAHDQLDTLQLLANVCRHGEGVSLDRLSQKRPELWHQETTPMPGMPQLPRFRVDNLSITVGLLEELGSAIEAFWEQSGYIYLESLNRKHDSVVKQLVGLRSIWAI